jgi:Holliday junction resolvase
MNTARKGRRAEHRARAILEASGFSGIRAAGSKGFADLVAWDGVGIRFVSVKCGTKYLSSLEREALQLMPRPANSSIEVWRFRRAAVSLLIERL